MSIQRFTLPLAVVLVLGFVACDSGGDGGNNVNSNNNSVENCGNDVAAEAEICDGQDLRSNDCASIGMGFGGGTLACNATCDGWDTASCNTLRCGNNTVDGGEICDGTDHGDQDCTTVGAFAGGTLACNANCMLWDISQCTIAAPVCGNGVQEAYEGCDGSDLRGRTCMADYFFDGGTLACDQNCAFDLSGCTNSAIPGWTCIPEFYDSGFDDDCDCGCGLVDPDCADATAGSCDFCNFEGSCGGFAACLDEGSIIDPTNNAICTAPTCGNNIAQGFESCDGNDLRGFICEVLQLGFTGGTIACDANCHLDVSGCTAAVCGDNTIGGFEHCDGTDLNGETCASLGLGYAGGTLSCDGSCNFDTSQCTMPVCGDNVAAGAEECDGTDMGADFTDYPDCADWGWAAGTITCTAGCDADFSACTGGSAPEGWTCLDEFYGDGECDCGCGVGDSDCANQAVAACAYCGEPGACTNLGTVCPGNINPTDNSQCI